MVLQSVNVSVDGTVSILKSYRCRFLVCFKIGQVILMISWEFNYFLRSNLTLVIDHVNFKKIIPLKLFYSYAQCHQDEFRISEKVILKLVKYTDLREERMPFKSLIGRRLKRPDLTEFNPQYLIEEVVGLLEIDLMGLFDNMIMGKLVIDKDNYIEYVASTDTPLEIPSDRLLIKCIFKSLNLDYLIILKVSLNEQHRLLSLKSFSRAACFLIPIDEPLNDFICQLIYKEVVVGKAELKFRIGEQSKHLMPEPSRFSLDILKKDVVLDVVITSSADVQMAQSVEPVFAYEDKGKMNKLRSLLQTGTLERPPSTVRRQSKARVPLLPFPKMENVVKVGSDEQNKVVTLKRIGKLRPPLPFPKPEERILKIVKEKAPIENKIDKPKKENKQKSKESNAMLNIGVQKELNTVSDRRWK